MSHVELHVELVEIIDQLLTSVVEGQRRKLLSDLREKKVRSQRLKEVFDEVILKKPPDIEQMIDVLDDINISLMFAEPDWSAAGDLVSLAILVRNRLDNRSIPKQIRHRFLLQKAVLGIMLGSADRQLAVKGDVPRAGSIPALAQYWLFLAGAWGARSQWQLNHDCLTEEIDYSLWCHLNAVVEAWRCQPWGNPQQAVQHVFNSEHVIISSLLMGAAWCYFWRTEPPPRENLPETPTESGRGETTEA